MAFFHSVGKIPCFKQLLYIAVINVGTVLKAWLDYVIEEIENALNTIATTTERSGNMKKVLKHTIYETVSTLRKLFVKLTDQCKGKSRSITELEALVASTKYTFRGLGTKQQRDRNRHLALLVGNHQEQRGGEWRHLVPGRRSSLQAWSSQNYIPRPYGGK